MRNQTRWTLDAGNTALKLTVWDGNGRVVECRRLARPEADGRQAKAWLGEASATHGAPEWVVGALGREADRNLLLPMMPAGTMLLSAQGRLPFRLDYTEGTPGADRLANVMALRHLSPERPALSIDVGTAVNLEVTDRAGAFVGGAILPGPEVMARSLSAETGGRLPVVDLGEEAAHFPAKSTSGSIRTGILLGVTGALERLVLEIEASTGVGETTIYTTGGGMPLLAPYFRVPQRYDAHLTARGLYVYGLWRAERGG